MGTAASAVQPSKARRVLRTNLAHIGESAENFGSYQGMASAMPQPTHID